MSKKLSSLRALFGAGRSAPREDSARATELRDPAWLVRSSGWAPASAVSHDAD